VVDLSIWDSMADPVSMTLCPNLATFFNYFVFKSTRMTQQMLRFVEPYITYGYALFKFIFQPLVLIFWSSELNLKSVRELIYKCGYGRINK
jgi:hypothetical protein